ncbi:MAG: DMT family transporter [SAR202 cluster bacterium]|nr:DMT family transporter [SAR202 cluster bacterium]
MNSFNGVFLSLAAAAMLGLNTAVVRRGVLKTSAYNGMIISIPLSIPVFFFISMATGQLNRISEFSSFDYLVLGIAGIINFLGGRYSQFLAIQAVGANLTAPVRVLSALFGAVLGGLFLGEEITLLRGFGIVLIILAPLIAFLKPGEIAVGLFDLPRGILFGLIGALSYGGSTFLLRLILADTDLVFLGAFIAHLAATIVLVISLGIPGRIHELRKIDKQAIRLFAVIAVIMTLAQTFRFSAIEMTDTAVVAPLIETGLFFGIGFAYVFNRKTENFSPAVLGGIIIAVIGAIAIAA